MQYKITKKLFNGQYQYKVVLVCPGANAFRSGNMATTLAELKKVDLSSIDSYTRFRIGIKTQDELDYAFKLQSQLSQLEDIDIRVESPWVTVYTNSNSNVTQLISLDEGKVKYVSLPPTNTILDKNTIIMPKMMYDFRITLGKTNYNHVTFINWAESSSKLKLTKSCKRDLSKDRSWGGTYFYITGENTLLMAKMHLGDAIAKVERIIKG